MNFKDSSVLELQKSGDVIVHRRGEKPRMITRDGYTIIFEPNKNNTILHPNGSVSHADKYVNTSGRGADNNKLHQVPTLKRLTEKGQVVTRRDDEVVIVEEQDKKWVRFSDHTQYLHQEESIIIEK